MTYFVCLDSCVLVSLYLNLRSGSEAKGFNELKALIEAKRTKLLVPQVTILELEKFVNNAERELLSTVARIETLVGNEGQHVKDNLGQALAEPLETWRKKKAEEMRAVADGIFDWLKTGEQLKFTLEIAHETRCRIIAGKFPHPKSKQKRDSRQATDGDAEERKRKKEDRRDQDCFIIDSLISHFGGKVSKKNLLFATNDNGFGTFGNDGTGPLDDTFQAGLPPARIFNDLSKLVAFVKDKKTVALPTPDEVEAEKKREVEEEIKQEIKFEQEATAQILKPVVARFEMPIDIGPPGSASVTQRVVPGMRLGGVYIGPHLVQDDGSSQRKADFEDFMRRDHQRRMRNMENNYPPANFFDTQNSLPPSAPPDVPAPGLQTFDASNLGDEKPKTKPDEHENPPK